MRESLCGILTYPCSVTGAPVCAYSRYSAQPLCSQFNASVALCLAPTGTSLKEHPRLLLCVLAFMKYVSGYSMKKIVCQAIKYKLFKKIFIDMSLLSMPFRSSFKFGKFVISQEFRPFLFVKIAEVEKAN